jgi:DNA-binding CsgD family transcriptional regulator
MRVPARLTRRETEVLAMAADGLTDKEIAARLGLARSTVSNEMSTILLKLDAANRAQAVAIAVRSGTLSGQRGAGGGTVTGQKSLVRTALGGMVRSVHHQGPQPGKDSRWGEVHRHDEPDPATWDG